MHEMRVRTRPAVQRDAKTPTSRSPSIPNRIEAAGSAGFGFKVYVVDCNKRLEFEI